MTDKNVEDEEDLSEAVATDTEKDTGSKAKPSSDPKVLHAHLAPVFLKTNACTRLTRRMSNWQEKKKKGSKKEKTSKKSSSPSRGVTFEGSQQATHDKAKEAKEKADSKVAKAAYRACRACLISLSLSLCVRAH
jgi:hypothetical protein